MAENRLDIILGAKTDGLKRDLRSAAVEAKKFGDDTKKAIDEAARTEKLEQGLEQIEEALQKVGKESKEAFEKAQKAAQEAEREVRDVAEGYRDAAGALRELAGPIDELASKFREAGAESRKLEQDLRVAFANPEEALKYKGVIDQLKKDFGDLIDADEFGLAAKRLETLGIASEKNFGRMARVAAATGKGLDDFADDFGEFLADVNSGVVDPDVIESIRANFGIGAKELKKFGAELDGNNKLLTENRAQIQKAQDALIAYIDNSERFNNVAERGQDALGRLQAETKAFNQSVGDQIGKLQNAVAQGLLPWVEKLNESSDGFKTFIGLGSQAASSALAFGAQSLELAAFASIAGLNFKKLKAGAVSAATAINTATGSVAAFFGTTAGGLVGLAAAAAGIALIAKTGYDAAKAMDQAEQSTQAFIETQDRLTARNKDVIKYTRQSADEIIAAAAKIEDAQEKRIELTRGILAAQLELQKAEDAKDKGAIQKAQDKIDALEAERQAQAELAAAVVTAQQKQQAAVEAQFEASREAFNAWRKDVSRGVFDSQKQALSGLEGVIGGLDGEALKEAQAERRKIQADLLKKEVEALRKRYEAEKITSEQLKKEQDSLLAKYQANSDLRKEIERGTAEVVDKQAEKILKRKEALLQAEEQLTARRMELAQQAQEAELSTLEEKFSRGEEVGEQLEAEIDKRAKLLQNYVDEQTELAKVATARKAAADIKDDPKNAGQIKQQQAEAEKQLDEQAAQRKQAIDQERAEKQRTLAEERQKRELDHENKLLDLQRQRFDEEKAARDQDFARRKDALDFEASTGTDVSARRKALEKEQIEAAKTSVKERLELEKQAIQSKLQAANVGASARQQELNAAQAELELTRATRQAREELRATFDSQTEDLRTQTAELQKQLDLLKSQNSERKKGSGFDFTTGSVQTVEEAFGGGDSNGNSDAIMASELERRIKRNKGILGNEQNNTDRDVKKYLGPESPRGADPASPQTITSPELVRQNELTSSLLAATQGMKAGLDRLAQVVSSSVGRQLNNEFAKSGFRTPGIS